MSKATTIRILIADDHPVVRQGLAAIIERELDMTIVGQAGNGHEAIEIYRSCQPDIVLMDLRMPQLSGVGAIKAICTEFQNPNIIILTTYDDEQDIHSGIEAGARGCLLKESEPDELLKAIRTVACGQKYITPAVAAKLKMRSYNPQLSDRQLEILRLIARGKNYREIAEALFIVEGTVKFHVRNILNKLGVNDPTQAVVVALQRGILDSRSICG